MHHTWYNLRRKILWEGEGREKERKRRKSENERIRFQEYGSDLLMKVIRQCRVL